MKKAGLIILLLFLILHSARADYFENLPYTITQPDGKTISCFVTGDEFFNFIHDKEGFTIIQDQDGYYYYAVQDGDLLKPSPYRVNSVNPASAGLKRWARISVREYKRRHDEMFFYKKSGKGGPENAPQTGSLNNLVIFIRFADDAEFSSNRQSFDDVFNPETGNSLKSYYKEVSYNNLLISSSHYPACSPTNNISYKDFNQRSYYQPYNATTNTTGYKNESEKGSREHSLLASAVNWINSNSPVPSSINIDGDGNNYVDNICFIIAGSNGAWDDLLWAHRWALTSQGAYINGKRVFDYTLLPETQVSVRTICHEMFHVLGAPDLYHYTNQGVISPAGSWDLMESGGGHMLSYMKWKYSNKKWIKEIPEITATGTYILNPVTSPDNNCYRIASPFSSDEYFIVEYRKKTGTFEGRIPGSGLIVYRIDPRVRGNADGPPDEVYVYRPGGTTTINGSVGNAYFSATVGRTSINDFTNPSSFLQNGKPGGLSITNISADGATISFKLTLPDPPPAPVSRTPINIFNSSFTARWSKSNNASGYSLDVATDIGFISKLTGYSGLRLGDTASWTIRGLNPKTSYYYRVRAFNAGGSSPDSDPVTVKTLSTPSAIPASITAISCNDLVTLRWNRSSGEDFKKYFIYGGKAENPFIRIDSSENNISDTIKVLGGFPRGQTFYYFVSAVNYDGAESSLSPQASAMIKTGVIPRIKSKFDDVLVCYNQGDSIKAYNWYKGSALLAGETGQYIKTNRQPGIYKVETTDQEGCKNSSASLAMAGIFTNTIVAFPNPASSRTMLKLENDSFGKTLISLYNASGIKVLEFQTEKTERELRTDIPLANIPQGYYQVYVRINNRETYSTMIIVGK
jgi:M6 family metalloprotease-like protein